MKKILLPMEGAAYPTEVLDWIMRINGISPVMLTAAFVPEVDYAQLYGGPGAASPLTYITEDPDLEDTIRQHSEKLEDFCLKHGILSRLHTDRYDFALSAIKKESRFADVLAISSAHFFSIISQHQPNAYMKEILHDSECPILLIPEKAALPGEIVLAYDGSRPSVHAIKQFAYLFPEYATIRTTLVYLKDKHGESIPDKENIEELVLQHFRNCRVLELPIRHEEFFNSWLPAQQAPWLVTGAYGRSDISRLFSGSFVSRLIAQHKLPIFIAHP